MQIIKVEKDKRKFKINAFGCMFFSKIIYKEDSNVKTKFLFGLFYLKYNMINTALNFRFCGIKIFSKRINEKYITYNLLGIPIFYKSSKILVFDIILKQLKQKKLSNIKNIYLLLSCTGETLLFLQLLRKINVNHYEDSIFIATKKYHIYLCKMFCPEIKCLFFDKLAFSIITRNYKYCEIYKKINFYSIFRIEHFIKLENQIRKNNDIHFYNAILNEMKINQMKTDLPQITKEKEISIQQKAKAIGLNLNKFIFIAPESQSNKLLSNNFWDKIFTHYKAMGYDIFSNVIFQNEHFATSKTCYLDFEESYLLASKSKAIISLRSGLIDTLSTISENIPMVVLYTQFRNRPIFGSLDSDKVLSGFTLKKLPNVNAKNIYEYDVNKYKDENILINEIIVQLNELIKNKTEQGEL